MGACCCRPQRAAEAAVRAGTLGHAVSPATGADGPKRPSPPQQPSEDEMMDAIARLPRPGDFSRRRAEAEALRRAEPGKTPNVATARPWIDPEQSPGPLQRMAAGDTRASRPRLV